MIRFLHTADWQIDKPFGGYAPEVAFALKELTAADEARIGALVKQAVS